MNVEGFGASASGVDVDPATVLLSPTACGDSVGDGAPSPVFDGSVPFDLASACSASSHMDAGAKAALLAEEVTRARGWAWIALLLSTGAAAFTPLLELAPLSLGLLVAALVSFVTMSIVVLLRTRSVDGYSQGLYRVWGYGSALMSLPLMYALGVFSPTPLIVTLGLTFFSLGLDRRHALLIPCTAIVGYLLSASLIAAGIWPDLGISNSNDMSSVARLFFVLFVPLVFLATMWFARVSRAAMHNAIDQAVNAQRLAGQREAQLMEAQQDLREVLRAAAGFGGRYTGESVAEFHLGAVVGRGAMGEVYAANHVVSGRPAAVKLLRGHAAGVDALIERFIREGRIAASLDVPNVVEVFDVGVVEHKGPYIAMELLQGEDLAALLRHTPQLGLESVRALTTQIAAGLDAAHAAGIVHRDLKPGSIFLHRPKPTDEATEDDAEVWKVLDFGVSKLAGSEGTLTQGDIIGTPSYMAPEQARGHEANRRADIYALGAVLYRALTGRAPFTGPDMPSVLFDVVYRMPVSPCSLRPELSKDLERVLAVPLAKAPGDRFASAGELAQALDAALDARLPRQLVRRADDLLASDGWGERVHNPISTAIRL